MAWTTPKTWVNGNLVTAADLNEQLRDNLSDLDSRVDSLMESNGFDLIVPSSVSGSAAVSVVDGRIIAEPASVIAPDYIQVDGVFSSAYDNYRVMLTVSYRSGSDPVIRLTAGGTPTTSGYSSRRDGTATGITTQFPTISGGAFGSRNTIDFWNVNRTSTQKSYINFGLNSVPDFERIGGLISTATQFDGFRLLQTTSAHEFQARLTVYGYK